MAVLKTSSPVRSTGAPKLLPSKTVPSSRARTAGFNWAYSSRFGGNFYLNTLRRWFAALSWYGFCYPSNVVGYAGHAQQRKCIDAQLAEGLPRSRLEAL